MSAVEARVYDALLIGGFVVAGIVFLVLLFVVAPYGRHARGGWGATVPALAGWLAMEAPAALFMPAFFFWGAGHEPRIAWVFVGFWLAHYGYRGWIYPFRRRNAQQRMAVVIAMMGLAFNLFNGYMNGRYLGLHAEAYDAAWLMTPQFILGAAMFIFGFAVNQRSDEILIRLRKPGETGYRIPCGGFYRWVSSPNYFGEVVEWAGWAVMTWSLPGLLFAVWTGANLVPRAISNHRWYLQKFPDYPKNRRAIVPFLV